MKTFKEFNEGKGYISLEVSAEDSSKIAKILNQLGINNVINDFHVTMMYDKSNPNIDYIDNSNTYNAKIDNVNTLGEPGTKWYSIALELESPDLHNRHKELKDMGYTHSYPSFIAHTSLKYKPSEEDIKTIKDNIDMFKELGTIQLNNEKIKVINENN